jgi:hypothetical protein
MKKSDKKKAVLDHEKRDAIKYVDAAPDVIGEVPPNKIPIIDRHGIMRGHIGHKAGEATARRVGSLAGGAKLGAHKGRPAWIETCGGKR